MEKKANLFGHNIHNTAVVNSADRNYSFGKAVTLGLQKQTSTTSQRSAQGFETNQLFASKPKSELESNNLRNSYSSAKGKLGGTGARLQESSSVQLQPNRTKLIQATKKPSTIL